MARNIKLDNLLDAYVKLDLVEVEGIALLPISEQGGLGLENIRTIKKTGKILNLKIEKNPSYDTIYYCSKRLSY